MLYPNLNRCAKCFGEFGKCFCREITLGNIISKMKKGLKMESPKNPPICKHGHSNQPMSQCRECYNENTKIYANLKPLTIEYWNSRGRMIIDNLVYRAYKMGMNHHK